ncbi:MAG TPA: phosphoenolpyruvate--protein phosphotransferase [Dictyobacter sp.]|jgi:phosphotransferase system enzyme I (PtsI)|nr:phosphoenolpyruvate--protein phosphotransferase [Dictyobacter sp.]
MSAILRGIPATRGVVVGTGLVYDLTPPFFEKEHISPDRVEYEWDRLQKALQEAIGEVTQLRDQVEQKLGKEQAAIFDAHLLILDDEALLDLSRQHIEQDLMGAEWALWESTEEFVQILADLENEYFQARATDIHDIRTRVLYHLQGRQTPQLRYLSEPVIVIARDLLPSDTAGLDAAVVLGIVTEEGGPTSHTAILARQMGIPAVVGVKGLLEQVRADESAALMIALDARSGEIVLNPEPEIVQRYTAAASVYKDQQQQLEALRTVPAITPDGVSLELAANIGRPRDAMPAVEAGASGVGLFRTEFLFLDRDAVPSEAEQLQAYSDVLRAFADKPVIVRTLDIGGDKHISYLSLPEENNPFLGLRGIRLCLDSEYQPLFRTQLRALLQAAQQTAGNLWIMFPMICDLRELRQAKAFLVEVEQELLQEGKLTQAVSPAIKQGIMLETPAAVWLIDQLAKEADFFSIGTNDLAQYTLASDRMNARLGELHRPFHPAVMRAIAHAVRSANEHQRWIGMCGELAGDPRVSAFLLGLGIQELSMEPKSLNAVKQVIRQTSSQQARELVEQVLNAENSAEIEQLLR